AGLRRHAGGGELRGGGGEEDAACARVVMHEPFVDVVEGDVAAVMTDAEDRGGGEPERGRPQRGGGAGGGIDLADRAAVVVADPEHAVEVIDVVEVGEA